MRVTREDYGAIKRSSPTPQGGLLLEGYPTRAGVLKYKTAEGGVVRELRPPEEVFAQVSLDSLKHAPLTDLHPPRRVDSTTWREVTVGHVTEKVDEAEDPPAHVCAEMLVADSEMLLKIDRGERKELSAGYDCDLDPTPGVFDGEAYDAIQRNIRYNHVALLPSGAGRAGPTASLRLDGAHVAIDTKTPGSGARERNDHAMKTVRIDGKDYEVGSDAHIEKLEQLAEARVKSERERADTAEAKLKAETARADAAELEVKKMPERIAARVALESAARKLCPTLKADGKDDVTLMVDVLNQAGPRVFGKGYTIDSKAGREAVNAVFDALKRAYDAMPAIGEDDPEEEKKAEGEDSADEEMPAKKDSRDDSFAARARAAAERDSRSSTGKRITAAGARERMLEGLYKRAAS